MPEVSDCYILDMLKKHLNRGGELLFQRYYKPLVLFADSYMPDSEVSEDLVQDVFYQFLKNKSYLTLRNDNLATYLFRAVRNTCLNQLAKDKYVTFDIDELKYDAVEEVAQTVAPELIDRMMEAVEELPERSRLVVKAVVLESKRYKEVADELGISLNTVKSLLSAGLSRLRSQFPPEYLLMLFLPPYRPKK